VSENETGVNGKSQHSFDANVPVAVVEVTDAVPLSVNGPEAGTMSVGASVVTPPTGTAIENVSVDCETVPVNGPE